MRFFSKYDGVLPELVHSPAAFAMKGRPFTFSAACRPSPSGEVPDRLFLHFDRTEKIAMPATDTFTLGDCRYEIYSVTVPGEKMSGDAVTYLIASDEALTSVSETFRLELLDPAVLPPQPPLRITEIYGRPKGLHVTNYIGLVNPSDADTDLYGYEILAFDGRSPSGTPIRRLPLADAPGAEILAPGEYAASWGIHARNFTPDGDYVTPERFFEAFCDDLLYRDRGWDASTGRVIPVTYYEADPETGDRTDPPERADLPYKAKVTTLCVVPRGGGAGDVLFSLVYSDVFAQWDTPVKRSSRWTADPREPDKGICLAHRAPATPGFPEPGERAVFSPNPPLILPVSPDRAVYISGGDCPVSFAVVETGGDSSVCSAEVVCIRDGEERAFAAVQGVDGTYTAVLPADLVRELGRLEFYIRGTDTYNSLSCGKERHFVLPVYDDAGPAVTDMLPTPGYVYDARGELAVRASYYDVSGTDAKGCRLTVDGRDVTGAASFGSSGMTYRLAGETAKPGSHSLELVLRDGNGNESRKRVSFGVSDMKELSVFRGEVHSHTADSDGSGAPADAYAYARDVGKVDYFAVTDHSHYLTPELYAAQIRVADGFDEPGRFAALYGWEMTWNNGCGYWGHMNVLNTRELVNDIHNIGLPDLYSWLGSEPSAVAMFNHPGLPWGNFDEYAWKTPEADRAVCLSEIRGMNYDREYSDMLAAGWHASPVSNEDNHNPFWTTSTDLDGCVLAPALTRQNVIDAFRARRTYTTSDPTMKVFFRINGEWMGSRLKDPEKLDVSVSVSTERPEGIGRIELIAEDRITVAVREAGLSKSVDWKLKLAPDYDYYYLRVTSPGRYCVTAPVWIEGRTAPQISGLEFCASADPDEPLAVTVRVRNTLEEPLRDLRVSCYLTPSSGFREQDAEPYFTVCVGRLSPGDTAKVTRQIPSADGVRRLTAAASAVYGRRRIRSTACIMTSPVTIAAVCPESAPLEAEDGQSTADPFPYVTLYNSSPAPADLTGGRLLPWTNTGKQPSESRIFQLDGIVIPPRSAAVIWDRHGLPLGAGDFNAFYGTELAEGTELFVTDVHFLSSDTASRRLELSLGGETVSRVLWNFGAGQDHVRHPGREYRYVRGSSSTGTETPGGYGDAKPGAAAEEGARRQVKVAARRRELAAERKSRKSDARAEDRRSRLSLTGREGTAVAVGAAAAAASLTAAVASLFGRKKGRK
jgi:hypothetical protein